ncbi:AAA family ATPase [Oxalobacteraceae bacterium]|nr:AAA family ATPase [Oxalobacteraceae bacterium]
MMQGEVQEHEVSRDGKVVLNQHRLKALRKQHGLSQDALAQLCLANRLCVSIASIKRAETGKSVLYRTASHLARVYGSELDELIIPAANVFLPPVLLTLDYSIEASERPAYSDYADHPEQPVHIEQTEQRNVLELLLLLDAVPPAALAAQIAAMTEQFGGMQQQAELAIFGVPRAYGSDAARCLQCALGLAALLQGRRAALIIRSRLWPLGPADEAARQRLLTLLPATGDSTPPPVYIERAQGVLLGERFVFEPTGFVDGLLRVAHARQGFMAAQYPLIGRYVEVQQFKATLETTLAYQCGHILYLRGVAGIGKSRLIQEFIDITRQNDVAVHLAEVLDFGVRGDATPLGQLVRSLLGLPAGAPAEAQLRTQMQQLRLPEELRMHLRAILGMVQPDEAATLFGAMSHPARAQGQIDALRELILRSSVERPLLLVLEDIHWSSPELLATLVALLPEVQEAPIIWLLSSRFEHDPLEHTLRPYLNGLPVTMLDLATLRQQEALAMARHGGDPDPAFHDKCVARAQGNPLFLSQLLLAGRGQDLPGSLKNLIQTKLDLLSAPQRQGVRVASAIGQHFSLSFLRAVLRQPEHEVLDCVRQYIVRPRDRDNYVFVHDLVMQGIYQSMPAGQRDDIHVALARCYEDSDRKLAARHLHKARHRDAPAALLAVIDDSIASYQYPQALELIGICQGIDYEPRDEYRLQLVSGRCHAKMGQTQRAKAAFAAALALAAGLPQKIAAVTGLAAALNVLEDLVAEETLIDQTLAEAQAAGVDEGLAELYYLKGNIYFPAGNFTVSRQLHELSQRHARSRDTEARALSGIGDSYYAQGRIVTAHGYFRDCLALCEEHGLADIEASNRFMLGTVRIYLNETAGALDDALASADLARRVGNRRAEIVSRLTAGWALLSLGQAAGARAQVEQGLEVARNIGASRFEPFLNESMVRVLLLEDKPGEAHELALQAWDAVQRNKLHKFIGPWVLSTLALVEPDARARQLALEQGQALLDQGCVAHNSYRYYVSAMESCLIHGQAAAVRALAERFAASVADEPSPWASHHIALARASAAWLEQPQPAGQSAQQAELHALMRRGHAAGLAWVMPLWRTRLGQALSLE